MKFTTPVSMPCTKEQFEELKPLLEAMGYEVERFDPIDQIICTNFHGKPNICIGMSCEGATIYKRTFIPTYNKDLFLALAAMTDEPNGIAGEWWKCKFQCGAFYLGQLYKGKPSPQNIDYILLKDNKGFEKIRSVKMDFTKATVSEIFAHFGVSYGKVQAEPIQSEIPQPKPMLELKQIDDNTIEYNGKLFKHTGEDVVSPLVQNVKEKVRYTVEYCKGKKIAVHCPLMSLYLDVDHVLIRNGYPKSEHLESMYGNNRRETAIYFDAIITIGNVEDLSSRGYKIITSTQFIADNAEQQQDEVLYPWQKEFEILCFQSVVDKTIEYSIDEDKTYGNNSIRAMIEVGSCYNSGAFIIKSIRRISDNVMFTVGDKVQFKQEPAREIKSLKISEHEGTILANDSKGDMNLMHFNPYKLPTLAEVFKKVQPTKFLNVWNGKVETDAQLYGLSNQNCLSTESQVKQLQAWIALRNIADYFNGEVAWFPTKGGVIYSIGYDLDGTFLVETFDFGGSDFIMPLGVAFKHRDHAEQAIAILQEAGLLDALKG